MSRNLNKFSHVIPAALLLLAFLLPGCSAPSTLSSIQVTPSTASVGAVGSTVQFSAIGTYSRGKHPAETRDVTSSVTWATSTPATATITTSGLATSISTGTTSITATLPSSSGPVVGTASLSVASGNGGGQPGPRDLTAITLIPGNQTLNTIGETAQLIAIGTFSSSPTTQSMSGLVTWQSSDDNVATVNSSGQVTAVGCGSSTCTAVITATGMAIGGATIVGQSTLTVSTGVPPALRTLSAITIVPGIGTQTLNSLGETAQFLAIGTFTASPTTQDLTDMVTWQSSDVSVATVNSSGLATAVNCATTGCLTFITASSSFNNNGGNVIGTSNLTVNPGSGSSNLPSLSVYQVGAGVGKITSSPAGITCNSGSGCTGYFTKGSTVTLTATPNPGASFGGWSSNCTPTNSPTCTVVMNANETVGAIFN